MGKKVLFCFGLGFSALRLSSLLQLDGWEIRGTCRTREKANELKYIGIKAHIFDGTEGFDPLWLDGTTHVLSSIPPNPAGDPVLNYCWGSLETGENINWVGYLSTTGVYGNSDGEWVDETSPTCADVPRSKRRVKAEREWLALNTKHRLPVHIFRLAGIYGPERNVLNTISRGKARRIDKPGHRFSRIHVDDIAAVLRASIESPNPGTIYNVCDDLPAEPSKVTEFGCELLGVEPPPLVPFEEAAKTMTAMGLSFWMDNRRVRNNRIKHQLGVSLVYPTYREGLRALVSEII
ncbi:MAG: NAD(P)-dependent oxidoreductase [Magnetovibrio sp.]|nr:NAD(P)-dependent oxidoreductase [Magnetovibrio sp.]